MLSSLSLILIALSYLAVLFAVAWVGDRKRIARDHRNIQAVIYALSLAVYCTSWTFYGAVGSAATTGWGYLPIYIGPALVMLFGFDILRRMATTAHHQRITSIADFIAYRYRRSHAIAVLVTVAAVIGSVPYIALQLKGITTGFEVISNASGGDQAKLPQLSLYVALALALFAILFGTRTMDASEHHRGLMWAIALESLVKLLAFLAIGLFVVFGIFGGFPEIAEAVRDNERFSELFSPWRLPEGFGIQLVLAMTAILCLPRQFHVAVVEFRDLRDLRVARWLFPSYLAVFAVLAMPVALAGLTRFTGQDVHPDSYVLALPIAYNQDALTVLAFLGGFSAASSMVIVATVALAIMVSNDIVMPLLLRFGVVRKDRSDLSETMLRVRRVSILAITLLAYVYFQAIESGVPLASIGLLSFSAAAQFAPALLIGIYWRGASRTGALCGLFTGVTAWFFFQLLPSFTTHSGMLPDFSFNEAAAWSLVLNAAVVVFMSLLAPDGERLASNSEALQKGSGLVTLGDLQATIGRFLGTDVTRTALATHLDVSEFEPRALATPATLQFGERLLAGSIGSASARTVLTTALYRRGLRADAVMDLLDRTSQAVQFNRELLESTLDNLSQGVSVVDTDLRLVGWNQRYLEMMDYPEGTVYLGQPIADLIRINYERGLLGEDDPEAEIGKRLERLREGEPYRYERSWLNGSVLEIQGNTLPGGGYVTTFTDITHFKDFERELQQINESLEQRVTERTQALSEAVKELEKARQAAESANLSKTRFLAAASHDLLQPMNAARLFVSILRQQMKGQQDEPARLAKRIDRSLSAAEELLTGLLDISKLDSGMLDPEPEVIELETLFEQLRRRFKPLALNRGLELRVRPAKLHIYSDRNLLYRILQNFLSNAMRYTKTGGVLLACRKRGDEVEIGVWDTGVGIDVEDAVAIFQEFHRLDYAQRLDDKGLGLGLAICDRIARMLGHKIELRSNPGRGSRFSILVPLSDGEADGTIRKTPAQVAGEPTRLEELTVLCIDNEPEILSGMEMLLVRWGCRVLLAANEVEALARVAERVPDMVLVDHHLAEGRTGLEAVRALNRFRGRDLPTIVITADRSPGLEEEVRRLGYGLLRKPIKPAALRALMTNTLKNL